MRGRLQLLALALLLAGNACKCGRAAVLSRRPQIDVSPNPILFQPLPVGKSAVITVQVRNLGNEDLHLSADPAIAENDGDGLEEYSLGIKLNRDCGGKDRSADTRQTLVPGDCAQVVVRYAPQNTTDQDEAVLSFQSDDPDHPTLAIPMRLGDPAHLQVCTILADGTDGRCDTPDTRPPEVDFGMVAKGQSALRKVRLRNVGKSELTSVVVYDPDGPAATEYARSANAPSALDPAQSVDLTVRFTPSSGGQRESWVQVDSADPARPSVKVPLKGIAEGPALCVDPSPLDFGQTEVGRSTEKALTLTSCGSAPVVLQQAQFDTLSSPAFTAQSLPAAQTLKPGAKVTVSLKFSPLDSGDSQGALLVPNDGQPDQFVPLRGNGHMPDACRLEASVSKLSFGQVVRGQSAQRDVTVANRGAKACNLGAVKIVSGSAYFSVATAAVVLRPGDTYNATVKYSPPANDTNSSDTGTLEFDSDDLLHPQLQIALEGQPAAAPVCKIKVTPAPGITSTFFGRVLQFGNVMVGRTKTLPVTFTNVGSANCSLSGWKFVPGIAAGLGGGCSAGSCKDFKLASGPATPLAPGQSTDINISFAPKNTSQQPFIPEVFLYARSGDSTLQSECTQSLIPDNTAGCIAVGLSGQGDLSNLVLLPADLDFGLVTLGCRARQETISLYNTGTKTTINIKSISLDPATAPFYVSAPPTPFAIPPQGKVQVQATYKPSKVGRETAALKFETDASNATSANPYVTVALSGTGTTDKHQRDTFQQAAHPTVDLLFVVDNSGSMGDKQSKLSQQAPNFISEALKYNADYHFGVTTTENDKVDKANSDASYPNESLYPGGLYGHPAIIDSTDANAAADFAKNIRVGTCCSDSRESGLDSAWHVLTPNANQTPPAQGSQGFLRDDARLVMVAVSDEQDQSNNSTAFYTDFFKQVKGKFNAGLVSFNAIVWDNDKCPASNGPETDGSRYREVAAATGGKSYPICTADWGQVARDLSLGAFQGRVQFALSRIADPATVVVQMNGAPQTAGTHYSFDPPTNSVIFKTVPPPAAAIIVDYDALCF
jgi:hypothetical protein